MLSVKRCIGKMCLERLRKSLTLTRHLSSLRRKTKRAVYHSLALGGRRERQEHLSQKEQLVQMHRSGHEWSKLRKLKVGDLAWLWGVQQTVACMHSNGWSQTTRFNQEKLLAPFPKCSGLGERKLSLNSILTLPSRRSFLLHLPGSGLHSGTESHICIVSGSLPKRNVKSNHGTALITMSTYYSLYGKIICEKEVKKMPKYSRNPDHEINVEQWFSTTGPLCEIFHNLREE